VLEKDEAGEATQTFAAEELAEIEGGEFAELDGPGLIVRSGGRAGESFAIVGDRTRIGRSPSCEIFLDDVTVSREHAVVLHEEALFSVEDLGSLNGTFVNRARIDKAILENGDELQIGKYRLTFVVR
jgi:pSer/pThr/pTyr-binding forkhead associated (FHA) protein